MSYLIPAPYSGMSSWSAHQRRKPPSSEPGTDYYMPIGTRLHAPTACRVVGVGGGIAPATGRFVTLDDGVRWYRYLHLSRADVRVGDQLAAGQYFGLSGASGYGSEFFGVSNVNDAAMIRRTGGPHVHVTAFRGRGYTFGSAGTVDFHAMTGGAVAGGAPAPPPPEPLKEDDEMIMLSITGIGTGTHKAALGNGIFRHFIGADPYEKIKNLARIQDDWQDVSAAELPALLRTYGCDLDIWDWRPNGGGFIVVDPLSATAGPGNVWTAAGAIRAAIAGIKMPTVDPAPIVAAVRTAIDATLERGELGLAAAIDTALAEGIELDADAIAKTVVDMQAARLVD